MASSPHLSLDPILMTGSTPTGCASVPLPFLHDYRLNEINYAVLSAYVAHKLDRNEEIEAAREAGVTLRDRPAAETAQPAHDQYDGRPHRPASSRTR